LKFATSRTSPLNGVYVARVPSTTAEGDQKILRGFTTSGLKGAGIRVYEYASEVMINQCRNQLEIIYWNCFDAVEIAEKQGMTPVNIKIRKESIFDLAEKLKLNDKPVLKGSRIIDNENHTICPLCLKRISANGFFTRLGQAEGRDVPDLTVTQINLFHIEELRLGKIQSSHL